VARMIRQGDVLLVPVDSVPDAVVPVARENGRLVLAEGEMTGHAHVIEAEQVELVTAEQANQLYLLVHGCDPVELLHEEHSTLPVEAGMYRVVQQRELGEFAPIGVLD
jgi:hypothetical protein